MLHRVSKPLGPSQWLHNSLRSSHCLYVVAMFCPSPCSGCKLFPSFIVVVLRCSIIVRLPALTPSINLFHLPSIDIAPYHVVSLDPSLTIPIPLSLTFPVPLVPAYQKPYPRFLWVLNVTTPLFHRSP